MEATMISERHVKLFRTDGSQAVRIPREFELTGDDAVIRKDGNRLIIESSERSSLLTVLAALTPIDEEFPPISELPLDPVDL
jgi:antitoxin VapB